MVLAEDATMVVHVGPGVSHYVRLIIAKGLRPLKSPGAQPL